MLEEPLITCLERDQDFLQGLLRKSEDDPEIEVMKVEAVPGCNVGDNYMSSVTRVTITGKTKTRRSFRKFILMKRQPASMVRRQAFRCDPAFRNETAAYETILPTLKEFSKSVLPFPSCLHATNQLIVLQDLQPLGYRMADRLKGLDLQHSKLALQALGRFHGTSLAMKHTDRNAFDKVRSHIQELVFVPEAAPVFGASMENSLKMALMSLEAYRGVGGLPIEEAVHKLTILKGTVFSRMFALVTPKETLSVICHGDFWINNMLFRYKDDIPEEVMFVDLQVARYASLSTDILHFLATSTEPEVATNYHDELIEVYHQSLCETITRLAPNAPMVTLKQINDEIEDHALYGLLMGFLLLPAVTAEKKIVNLDDVSAENLLSGEFLESAADSLSPKYFQRLYDLVMDFYGRGYI